MILEHSRVFGCLLESSPAERVLLPIGSGPFSEAKAQRASVAEHGMAGKRSHFVVDPQHQAVQATLVDSFGQRISGMTHRKPSVRNPSVSAHKRHELQNGKFSNHGRTLVLAITDPPFAARWFPSPFDS